MHFAILLLKQTRSKLLDAPRSGHTHQPEADRSAPRAGAPPRPGQGRPGLDRGVGAATTPRASRGARGDGERRRREAAQRGGAGAGKRARARGGGDGGEAHQQRR